MTGASDPDSIPDDATGADLAGRIAEDVVRYLAVRLAALLACVSVVAGLLSESASDPLKGACVAAGGVGIIVLLIAGLFRWRRSRQWWVVGAVIAACGGLLAAVFIGSR